MTTFYQDVVNFHRKFNLPVPETVAPCILDHEQTEFRFKFMMEELLEWRDAIARKDLVKSADALVDLVYVVLGTAAFQGLPFHSIWNAVHKANMTKVRVDHAANSKRKSHFDVVKPPGWIGPEDDIFRILEQCLMNQHEGDSK